MNVHKRHTTPAPVLSVEVASAAMALSIQRLTAAASILTSTSATASGSRPTLIITTGI